jgi:hypothetical protein
MPPTDSKAEIELEITGNVELDINPSAIDEEAHIEVEVDLKDVYNNAEVWRAPPKKPIRNKRNTADTEADSTEPKSEPKQKKPPMNSKSLRFWMCLLWSLELLIILAGATCGII